MQDVSPKPYNTISRAALSSQASSSSAVRLFSELGAIEGRFWQPFLDCTFETTDTIRVYLKTHLKGNILLQKGALHP